MTARCRPEHLYASILSNRSSSLVSVRVGLRAAIAEKIDDRRDSRQRELKMYRHCICIGVFILVSLPLGSQTTGSQLSMSPPDLSGEPVPYDVVVCRGDPL